MFGGAFAAGSLRRGVSRKQYSPYTKGTWTRLVSVGLAAGSYGGWWISVLVLLSHCGFRGRAYTTVIGAVAAGSRG